MDLLSVICIFPDLSETEEVLRVHLKRAHWQRGQLKIALYGKAIVCVTTYLMALEVLHRSFVFLSGCSRIEGAEVFAFAGLQIFFLRVEPIFSRL